MKTRSILPFAVFGLLLVALFALSSCDRGGASGATPTPTPEPSDAFSKKFGGPYPFAPHGEKASEKERDFECYKALGLSLSVAVELTETLFKDSIEANEKFPDRIGSLKYDTQKYNFVIAKVGENVEIIVAQWKNDDKLDGDKNVSEKCRCRIDNRWNSKTRWRADTMVNLFPEDKMADPRKSPCWLDSDREDGLLDAISKHFMLAQGAGATIDRFNKNKENNWYGWTAKEVLYAGQFFVDAGNNCISDVNGDSGTYQPKTKSYQPLKSVWEQFGKIPNAPLRCR